MATTMKNATTATPAYELEAMLGQADDGLDGLDGELSGELAEPDLSSYDLSGVNELDIRELKHRQWYEAEILDCRPDVSGAGNSQYAILLRVTRASELNEVDGDGHSVLGVTVFDQAATPRPPLDRKKLQSLWKIKAIARCCGLAELLPNGEVKRIKPGTKAADFIGHKVRFLNTVDREYDPQNPRNKPSAYSPVAK